MVHHPHYAAFAAFSLELPMSNRGFFAAERGRAADPAHACSQDILRHRLVKNQSRFS